MLRALAISVICLLAFMTVTAQPKHVLFILADDLGYGELGAYGNQEVLTPNLDQLANRGMKFTKAYANSTVCSPSRASILFGDYPDLLGVPGVIRDMPNNTWGNLSDNLLSLPQKMKELSFRTALIGKWHLGYEAPDVPNSRGFDYFKGFLGDMMDDYYTHRRAGVNWMRENNREIDPQRHATDLFTDWTINWLQEQEDQNQSSFVFLAYNAPHDPVQPPREYLEAVKQRLPKANLKRQKMIAFIEHLDANVGKLLSYLQEADIYKETLIVFTSDNGGALNYGADNGMLNGGKGDMLEGGIRIPCTVTWEDKVPAGITDTPFLLMDFHRLIPQLSMSSDQVQLNIEERKPMVWVRREGHRFGGLAYYAISDGRYKLLQNGPFEPYKLFDLTEDPLESNPLDKPEIKKELLNKLTKHIQTSGKVPWQ